MAEHDYEASCDCGAQWRVRLEVDDDAMATCLACGADTFDLIAVRPGGAMVVTSAPTKPVVTKL